MPALAIVHHPDYDAPMPPGHRFPMGKFAALRARLLADGLVTADGFHRPEPADEQTLARAHDAAYVAAAFACAIDARTARRIGLPITEPLLARARAAAGGTLLAARLALAHGVACNTAGGSHHAGPDGGAGFCVFNDVAAAALALLEEGAIARALVIDLDVHQGDGTAAIFADDPRVFTLSMHCAENFPTRKIPGDLDLPLPAGTGDHAYLEALANALPHAIARARPDLIFFNAGVDPHREDRLGKLALTDQGLAAREAMVLDAAGAVPLVGVIGGGYGEDLEALARRHAILHHAASRWLNATRR